MDILTKQKTILDLSQETISLKLLIEKGVVEAGEDGSYEALSDFLYAAPETGAAYDEFLDFKKGALEDVLIPARLFIYAFFEYVLGLTLKDGRISRDEVYKQVQAKGFIGLKLTAAGEAVYFSDRPEKGMSL